MRREWIGLVALVAMTTGACAGDGDGTPTATTEATSTATTSPTAVATAVRTPSGTATAVPSDPIPGLFREPRLAEPDTVVLLADRISPFPEHDGFSTVLYDIQAGTARDFGPGSMGSFSPGSRYMAWAAFASDRSEPSRLMVIDLALGEVNDLGEVGWVREFVDERHVRISPWQSNALELVDVESGESLPSSAVAPVTPSPTSERFSLSRGEIEPTGESTYRVFNKAGTERVLTVRGLDARLIGDAELLLLVDAGIGLGNIFIVDLPPIDATFVATISTEPYRYSTVPLVANERFVAWTPNYCYGFTFTGTAAEAASIQLEIREGSDPSAGPTMIFDRSTGLTTALSGSALWFAGFTPDGRLIDGAFGGHSLLDPATARWDAVLPSGSSDATWSADYRYASRGEQLGHGGVCPP